ncbi:MAG: thioesterase superfamily protein [Polaromonas sp.]|nr:thioesterase superfamily protein [Polaromonas sp.]
MSFESSARPAHTAAGATASGAFAADVETRALHGQLPADKELVLKVIPMPRDCNANGDIFGGWVMAQVDLAGAVLPARYVDGRMATVAVNQFIFKQPVRVGDILSFFAAVTRIGNTSITVQVEVFAEGFRAQGRYFKVTEASLTYVAIDAAGKPQKIARP